jgi:hypothetical protein
LASGNTGIQSKPSHSLKLKSERSHPPPYIIDHPNATSRDKEKEKEKEKENFEYKRNERRKEEGKKKKKKKKKKKNTSLRYFAGLYLPKCSAVINSVNADSISLIFDENDSMFISFMK